MDLRELRFAFRRHWPGAVVVFLICVTVGALGAFMPEKTYRSTATVFARPVEGEVDAARATDFVMPGLLAKIQTGRFRIQASESVPDDLRREPIDVVASAPATSLLQVQVEGADAEAVAAWANALVQELVASEDPVAFLSLEILDDARVPQDPVFPQPAPILAGSITLGLLAAIFVPVISFRLRRAFDTTEDVRQVLGTRLLGEMPVASALHRRSGRALVTELEEGSSDLAEAFQILRAEAGLELVKAGAPSVAVVSRNPGEGKSTIAVGLAWSLAAAGHPVTLVDADLRTPTVHEFFGRPLSDGLSDLDGHQVHGAIRHTGRHGLDFLSAGHPHARPGDVVASSLPRVLHELEDDGRLAVVDSPALTVLGEAPIVVNATRYLILVVDRSQWDLPALADSVARLRESGAHIVGVVVNRVPARRWRRRIQHYRKRRPPEHPVDLAPAESNGVTALAPAPPSEPVRQT